MLQSTGIPTRKIFLTTLPFIILILSISLSVPALSACFPGDSTAWGTIETHCGDKGEWEGNFIRIGLGGRTCNLIGRYSAGSNLIWRVEPDGAVGGGGFCGLILEVSYAVP